MKSTAQLRRKILGRTASLLVVGQGYVGLTIACEAAAAGFPTTGLDIDDERVEALAAGDLTVAGVADSTFRAGIDSGRLEFTSDAESIEQADIVLICVPTPLRETTPDLSYVRGACRHVADHLTAGTLVVLESTTYPGTTDEVVRPLLETSGLPAGTGFLLAYSPERIDPGNEEFGLANTPRILGGDTPEAAGVASLFYGQLVDKVVSLSSCRAAELAKLLENTFRHVNVALVNEMAILCHEMDIDVWEVIHAAETKPFGFMPFFPGPGVGGHCIPLDPSYLAWQVRRDAGHQFRLLELAQDVNAQMPAYVAQRIGDALNERGRAMKGSAILILGVAYKPNVGDIRESPALRVMQYLSRRGARLAFHDPYVASVQVDGASLTSAPLTNHTIAGADCVAVLTPHAAYDLDWILERASLVFDCRNAFAMTQAPNLVTL